jgi:catechol 2,3-dioxygenase-like lactoylglutathione lyase family enzyme|tara:strand:+ start:63 stop:449 length:387 start_codon:yes stop_codon:yes gene_type:complete
MIDHISIAVSDLAAGAVFYEAVLEPLGLTRLVDRPYTVGFGKRYPEFWLNARPDMTPVEDGTGMHICLRARTTTAVAAFHAAALANGGTDGGAPGMRDASTGPYFAAFIRDPDGNKIEAATFLPAEGG